MKKRYLGILMIATVSILLISIGATLAWLISSSLPVRNTFTVGKVQITLTETTGKQYPITPGVLHQKDPTVTVKAGSEACWLYVRIEKTENFDSFMTFTPADGWNAISGEEGIYYRPLDTTKTDQAIRILLNNQIRVKDTVTEEMLNALDSYPDLTFTAYAIQQEGIAGPVEGWETLKQEEEQINEH